MFSHQFYNVIHIVGLVLLMAALGGIALTSVEGGGRGSRSSLRFATGFHALGIFLILLGGFGMLARLGMVSETNWPGWVWIKVAIWGVLGIAAFLPYRFPRTAKPLLILLPVLGGLAAYMAIYKPL